MEASELLVGQLERLGTLLPSQKRRTGRPGTDHRTARKGIIRI
jgi:hypothetical protein